MISVCIPTFNGEKYIGQQIASILPQLEIDDEIIISDDGSKDNTLRILQSFNDNRIKIISNKRSKNSEKNNFMYVTKNVENALLNVSGDIIFLADQDDLWRADKVSIMIQDLKNYDLVLSDCVIIDADGQKIHSSYFEMNNSKTGIANNLIKNSYLGCCMAFKSSILETVLPMSKYEVPHDIWIGLLAEKFFRVRFIDETLVYYRRHGNNLSASSEKSSNTIFYKLAYRLNLIVAIITRIILLKK